jgi:hypothetical protein
MAGQTQSHRLRHLDAVDGGGEDAAGVAGTFAGGVEAGGVQTLKHLVPGDADGGRGAGFDAGQHRVRTVEAADLAAEGGECFADGGDGVVRQGC